MRFHLPAATVTLITIASSASFSASAGVPSEPAWRAAQASSFAKAQVVLGLDLVKLGSAKFAGGSDFAKLAYESVIARSERLRSLDADLKRACPNVDLRVKIKNIVVVSDKPGIDGKTAFYLSTRDLPLSSLRECIKKANSSVAGASVSEPDKAGIVTIKESTYHGLKNSYSYFGVKADGVLVVTSAPSDLAFMKLAVGSSFKMPTDLALNPDVNGAIWGAFANPDEKGKSGRAVLDCSAGTCSSRVVVGYPDEKSATAALAKIKEPVDLAIKVGYMWSGFPGALVKKLVKRVEPTRVGNKLQVEAWVSEAELKLVFDAIAKRLRDD